MLHEFFTRMHNHRLHLSWWQTCFQHFHKKYALLLKGLTFINLTKNLCSLPHVVKFEKHQRHYMGRKKLAILYKVLYLCLEYMRRGKKTGGSHHDVGSISTWKEKFLKLNFLLLFNAFLREFFFLSLPMMMHIVKQHLDVNIYSKLLC